MHIAHTTTSLVAGALLALTPAVLAQFSPASLIEGPKSLEAPQAEFAAAPAEGRAMLGVMLDVDDGTPVISSVMEKSPAARAGFQSGDRIIAVGGTPVANLEDLQGLLGGLGVGDEVEIGYERDGAEATKTVLLAAMDSFEREAEVALERSPEVQKVRKLRLLKHLKPEKPGKHKAADKVERSVQVKIDPQIGEGIHLLGEVLVLDATTGTEDPGCCGGNEEGESSFGLSQIDGGNLAWRLKAVGLEGERIEEIERILANAGKAQIQIEVDESSDCDCCPDCERGTRAAREIVLETGDASGAFFFDSDEYGEEGYGENHEIIIEGLPEGHGGAWFAHPGGADEDIVIEKIHGARGHHNCETIELLLRELHGAEGPHGEGAHGRGEHHDVRVERIHFGEGHRSAPHAGAHGNEELHGAHGGGHWVFETPHHEAPHHDGGHQWFPEHGRRTSGPHESYEPLMGAREELRALRAEMRELRDEMRALREMAREHARRR